MSWYNITFSLGDKWNDGHGRHEEFHLICNYPADIITKTYDEICMRLDWEFCDECLEYENNQVSDKGVKNLLKLGIITSSNLEDDGNFYIESTDDFVDIFFDIIKTKLPDLLWEGRNLDESILECMEDKGYGLFWD